MKVSLRSAGKRYNREWIFRNINHSFEEGTSSVILGANGSGKSTLIQLVAGNLLPSEGNIHYESAGKMIEAENVYSCLSIAAPYLELPEDYTLEELISFHFQFKDLHPEISSESECLRISELSGSRNKQVKYFSSGMKQRLRLILAILSNTPLLLLDEPCSNLDHKAIEWYKDLMLGFSKKRTIIVCSNEQKDEYSFCKEQIRMEDFTS